MKTEIRPEIGILMCNCVAVKKWVAWLLSGGAKCIAERGTQFYEMTQCFYVVTINLMSPYTIVSHKMEMCSC